MSASLFDAAMKKRLRFQLAALDDEHRRARTPAARKRVESKVRKAVLELEKIEALGRAADLEHERWKRSLESDFAKLLASAAGEASGVERVTLEGEDARRLADDLAQGCDSAEWQRRVDRARQTLNALLSQPLRRGRPDFAGFAKQLREASFYSSGGAVPTDQEVLNRLADHVERVARNLGFL